MYKYVPFNNIFKNVFLRFLNLKQNQVMKNLYLLNFAFFICFSTSAQWVTVSNMNAMRKDHVVFTLHSGKVLTAGGWTGAANLQTSEWIDSRSGTPSWTISSNELSVAHTTGAGVVLQNGKPLIIGGYTGSLNTTSCELYDTILHTWATAGSLNVGRSYHTATLLNNGKVLVVGGYDGTNNLNSCELYDPATNLWTLVPVGLATGRSYHSATLLNDGRVLIAGGFNPNAGFQLSSVEVYNPTTNSISAVPPMSNTRAYHGATLLNNGKILIAGGENFNGGTPFAYNGMTSCEIYDPATNGWTSAASMPVGAAYNKLITMANNKVLMLAGASNTNYSPSFSFSPATTFLYDASANAWTENPMNMDGRIGFGVAKLSNEKVLVTGGINQNEVELFELSTSTSVERNSNNGVFNVFPTPASNFVFLSSTLELRGSELFIIDALGRKSKVSPMRVDQNTWKVDLSEFQKGVFGFYLTQNGSVLFTQRVVIQ